MDEGVSRRGMCRLEFQRQSSKATCGDKCDTLYINAWGSCWRRSVHRAISMQITEKRFLASMINLADQSFLSGTKLSLSQFLLVNLGIDEPSASVKAMLAAINSDRRLCLTLRPHAEYSLHLTTFQTLTGGSSCGDGKGRKQRLTKLLSTE